MIAIVKHEKVDITPTEIKEHTGCLSGAIGRIGEHRSERSQRSFLARLKAVGVIWAKVVIIPHSIRRHLSDHGRKWTIDAPLFHVTLPKVFVVRRVGVNVVSQQQMECWLLGQEQIPRSPSRHRQSLGVPAATLVTLSEA